MRFVALLVPFTMNQMSAMTITQGNAGPKSRTRDSL